MKDACVAMATLARRIKNVSLPPSHSLAHTNVGDSASGAMGCDGQYVHTPVYIGASLSTSFCIVSSFWVDMG